MKLSRSFLSEALQNSSVSVAGADLALWFAEHNDDYEVSIDTRTITPGTIFCALRGEKVDGHDFVDDAQKKGASAALVMHHVESSLPQIKVKDVTVAMGQLSSMWRDQFSLPLIAVTGSNGKTTTKNFVAAVLSKKYKVAYSMGLGGR